MADTNETGGVPRTPRQLEIAVLEAMPAAISYTPVPERGVLLSDQIEHYVNAYKLIDPYNPDNLKPAGYYLSVGEVASVGGKTRQLSGVVGERELTIEPFEVAIIQTLERLNMPNFMIARWNIRVSLAYEGLLWVGAAQVDPGFKGYLSCPIYNLSDKAVTLYFGQAIALIDFVTTTTPIAGVSKPYPAPAKRPRVTFEEYNPGLRSALATMAREKIEGFENSLTTMGDRAQAHLDEMQGRMQQMQTRIDQFTGITFAAITILVGAVAVIATKAPAQFGLNLTSLLSMAAVFVSLICVYFVRPNKVGSGRARWINLSVLALAVLVGYGIFDAALLKPRLNQQLDEVRREERETKAKLQNVERSVSTIKTTADLRELQRELILIEKKLKI